ncbi:phosphomethylpyrimidine kinase [Xenorhabdus vietnamensis]|uniref:hydroxymethylpyrimidine kinase n=1 Tax=Xenorhabdus vietnamensis TaxID=351656 RepID=A0A1Y2SEM2_9GAMM|nr:phosphomethylpyrimidine kinase [Xenorhabdus vietnamensis]
MCHENILLIKTPVALSIAGSDSGGGAGIQADIKTMSALDVYATTVITALTSQNTVGIRNIYSVPAISVATQLESVLEDIAVHAIKIGMVLTLEIIKAIVEVLRFYCGPIILDPVMMAKSGDVLLQEEAMSIFRTDLLPLATLITPNLPEAAVLLGKEEARTLAEAESQGRELLKLGAKGVLMKGGHFNSNNCVDLLILPEQQTINLTAIRVDTKNTHGTGCTLSAAIAALMANGLGLVEAVTEAKDYLHQAILESNKLRIGFGHGPVHHFFNKWGEKLCTLQS